MKDGETSKIYSVHVPIGDSDSTSEFEVELTTVEDKGWRIAQSTHLMN